MFTKEKCFIFVKNYGHARKIALFDEKRESDSEQARRVARHSALGNLPHSRGSKQTELRSRSENPKAIPANKSRLAVPRPKTDVPPNLGERHPVERPTDR